MTDAQDRVDAVNETLLNALKATGMDTAAAVEVLNAYDDARAAEHAEYYDVSDSDIDQFVTAARALTLVAGDGPRRRVHKALGVLMLEPQKTNLEVIADALAPYAPQMFQAIMGTSIGQAVQELQAAAVTPPGDEPSVQRYANELAGILSQPLPAGVTVDQQYAALASVVASVPEMYRNALYYMAPEVIIARYADAAHQAAYTAYQLKVNRPA